MKKTIKVSAKSIFHGPGISRTFRLPSEFGRYLRFCPDPCDDKHNESGIQVRCGCGFPCSRTDWFAPKGFSVHAEWASPGHGRNNIVIFVEPDMAYYGNAD